METNIGAERATASLKISMDAITKDCIAKLETQYGQVLQPAHALRRRRCQASDRWGLVAVCG